MQEVFSQQRGACPGLTYHRIPVPDFCAPREEVRGCVAEAPGEGQDALLPPWGLGCGYCSPEGLSLFYKVSDGPRWSIHMPSRLCVCVYYVL